MDPIDLDIAASLAESARVINSPQTLEQTLDAIVGATLVSVPGFDHVGVTIVHRNGTLETKAGTGQLVWELDDLQYFIDEGPCVTAIREKGVVAVPDIRHEQRWPRYVREAVPRAGLRAQLAVRLSADGTTLGGLNLYSTGSATINAGAVQAAELTKRDETLTIQALPAVHARGLMGTLLPPVMGSMLEHRVGGEVRLRLYVSGDTLTGGHVSEIAERHPDIDVAVVHLGGTRVLLHTVTMDAVQGVDFLDRCRPREAVPVHHDDYRVFRSPLSDFLTVMGSSAVATRVRPTARGETIALRRD